MSSDRAFRRSVDRAQKFTAEKLDRNAAPVRIRSRHLTDENDVLRHNAWDDVAMAPDEEAAPDDEALDDAALDDDDCAAVELRLRLLPKSQPANRDNISAELRQRPCGGSGGAAAAAAAAELRR